MYAAIGGLVIAWALVLVFRTPIQARYWAWQLTRSDESNWQRHYFHRLASLQDACAPAAGSLLRHARPEVRRNGATLLHYARTPEARRLLLAGLSDPDAGVREAAAMGLAVNHDAEVQEALCEILADFRSPNAALAAAALGRMGGDRASAALLDALNREPPLEVKAEVIDGLGQIRVAEAVPLLEAALRDDRPLPAPPLSDRLAQGAFAALLTGPATAPSAARLAGAELELPATISALAARSLRLITGQGGL